MKSVIEDIDLFKPKRKDMIKEENIHFHALENGNGQADDDYDEHGGDEQFKNKFVSALVKFEDEEDV